MVDEKFVFKIPDNMPLVKACPLLCQGITIYEPLSKFASDKNKPKSIGVVFQSNLGVLGLKMSKAFGHDVTALITKNDLDLY